MADDPRWPRASAWLAGDRLDETVASLAVIGAPLHTASLSPSRADLAPAAIRDALHRYSTMDLEGGDIRAVAVTDLGDLDLEAATPEAALQPLSARIQGALEDHDTVAILGGDNSVTRPGVHGLGVPLARCGLLTLDAHFDLRDTTDGLSNGNPVRALLDDGLPGTNVVQVGIQSFANSPAYAEVARNAGITIVGAEEVHVRGIESVMMDAIDHLDERVDAIYVDIDVDVLDRGFSPATPGSRPGGLAPWEIRMAASLAADHSAVRAVDIVEVDPLADVADVTVLAAASFLLAFAGGLLSRLD